MINISFDSQLLTTLMGCPRLANERFNKDLVAKGGKSNSIEVGAIAHAILEFFNKALIDGKSRTDAIEIGFAAGKEYIAGYSETNKYIRDVEENGVQNTPEESTDKLIGWKYVLSTMEEYFDYYRNESWTVISAEETRKEIIYEDEDIRVLWKAKFDCIVDMQDGMMPVDHKTMKQRRDTLSLNNQFMGQCILTKSRTIVINKIGWQKSLEPHEKFLRGTISYSPDRLAEQINEVIPHYARMYIAYSQADYWPPNYTHCETKYGICDRKELCESDRHMRDDVNRVYFHKGKKWDIDND